jgi:hypothetical protein
MRNRIRIRNTVYDYEVQKLSVKLFLSFLYGTWVPSLSHEKLPGDERNL